jgi:hypothetical protein
MGRFSVILADPAAPPDENGLISRRRCSLEITGFFTASP